MELIVLELERAVTTLFVGPGALPGLLHLPVNSNSTPTPTRVFLIDDHPLYSTVLTEIMREAGDFEMVGTATDGLAALAFIKAHPVDLLLVDLMLPGMSGIEILEAVRDLKLNVKSVVFSGLATDESIAAAFALGVCAYVEKSVDVNALLATLRAVMRGEFPLNAKTSEVLRGMVRQRTRAKPLTAVDLLILKRLASHSSAKEIADEMGLSLSGIYKARARIGARIGAANWEGFAAAAASYGLMQPPGKAVEYGKGGKSLLEAGP